MSSKLRNLKVKPRLNASRSQVKIQETAEEDPKKEPEDDKVKEEKVSPSIDEPEKIFTPPLPVTPLPRCENSDTMMKSSTKFRKHKPMPSLKVSRSTQKLSESLESPACKNVEIQQQQPVSFIEPDPVFSPPPPPVSASPMRPRSETPRDLLQSPTYSINHNVHYPPTPQSPFMPIPHARIRTESLSSIKSIPANLQPRKKFRTEDQKIIDNKRESRERLSNKNVEKSQLRMFDMIYYNPSTNPMKPRTSKDKPDEPTEEKPKPPPVQEKPPSTSVAVPQLKLNAQGELVLDESSLVVENEEHRKNRILLANTNVVYYDELSTNYGFYKRQKRTREWPQEETVKFYRCLNTVGTDFSLMLNLFPKRTRRDLKLKFKKEEKNNPQLIDKALLKFNTFDIEELQRELEKEDEERRKEAENGSNEVKELVKRKILKKQEAKARAQQQIKSKVEKILLDGDEAIAIVDANAKLEIKENFAEKIEKKPVKRRAPKPNVASTTNKKRNVACETKISEDISLELDQLPTIKLETRDFQKEEKGTFNIIQQTMIDETVNEWNTSNVIDDIPQYPLIDLMPQLINEMPAKIESPARSVIEESHQVQEEEKILEHVQEEEKIQEQVHEEEKIQEQVQEMIPSTSTEHPAKPNFDEEHFLNSLNLEQLSIVVRQVDGENIYDIHETDPDTQLISDKPLNIPQHLKDILISVMTQDE